VSVPLLCYAGVEGGGGAAAAAAPSLRPSFAGGDAVCVAATLPCAGEQPLAGAAAPPPLPLPPPRCPPGVPAGTLLRSYGAASGGALRTALAAAAPAAQLAAAHARVCAASGCNAPSGGDACVPPGAPRFAGGAPAPAALAVTALGEPLGEPLGGAAPPAGVCMPFAALLRRAGELPPPAAADLRCARALRGGGAPPDEEGGGAPFPGARYCIAAAVQRSEEDGSPAPFVVRDGVSAGELLRAAKREHLLRSMGTGSVWVCNGDACNAAGPAADACMAATSD